MFTGEQLDQETDNYYLRTRYYSPNFTRFLSRDTYDGKPIDPLSQNHYLYAGGNPVMFVDPSGHEDMMSLTYGIFVNNILSGVNIKNLVRIVSVLFQLRNNKMYDISVKTTPFLKETNPLRNWIPHAYINASEIEFSSSGFRYDKGTEKPELAIYGLPTKGYVKKSPIHSYEWTDASFVNLMYGKQIIMIM